MTDKVKTNGKQGGKGSRSSKGGYSDNVGWINPQLNATDVSWLEDRGDRIEGDVLRLFEVLEGHQRLTCKLDDKSGRWLAILFDGGVSAGDGTLALSVRGRTPFDALVVLSYYYFVVYDQTLPPSFGSSEGQYG